MATQLTFAEAARARRLGGERTLTSADLRDFSEAEEKILSVLSDGQFHTGAELIRASGQQEGLRRLRELRQRCNIETRRRANTRTWEYRLLDGITR